MPNGDGIVEKDNFTRVGIYEG